MPHLSDLVTAWHTPSESGWRPARTLCLPRLRPERKRQVMSVIILRNKGCLVSLDLATYQLGKKQNKTHIGAFCHDPSFAFVASQPIWRSMLKSQSLFLQFIWLNVFIFFKKNKNILPCLQLCFCAANQVWENHPNHLLRKSKVICYFNIAAIFCGLFILVTLFTDKGQVWW